MRSSKAGRRGSRQSQPEAHPEDEADDLPCYRQCLTCGYYARVSGAKVFYLMREGRGRDPYFLCPRCHSDDTTVWWSSEVIDPDSLR